MAGTVVICFTDIVDSTQLLTRIGDEAFDDDWFGTPVVEGARLCSAAAAGQILVSEVVRLLAGSRGGHDFRSVGTLLATALRMRDAAGDAERDASSSANARRLAEQVGVPGWIERIDRLESGDLEPWRIETA